MAVRFSTGTDAWEYTAGAVGATLCTVIGWYQPTALPTPGNTADIYRSRNAGDATTQVFWIDSSGALLIGSVGGSTSQLSIGMAAGVWGRVAFTVNGTSGIAMGSGTPTGSVLVSGSGPISGNTPQAKYSLGGRGNADASDLVTGDLAAWKIYADVLSEAEILTEWSQILPVRTAGLYAAYSMDAANTESRLDLSGQGRMLSAGSTVTVDGPPIPRQRLTLLNRKMWLPSTAAGGGSRTGSDTAPATDTATRAAQSFTRAATDSAAAADTATRAAQAFARAATDTAAAADTGTRAQAFTRTAGDAAAAIDTAARAAQSFARSSTDSGAAADSAAPSMLVARNASDLAAAADSAAIALLLTRATSDTAAAVDAATRGGLVMGRHSSDHGGGADAARNASASTTRRPLKVGQPVITGVYRAGQPVTSGLLRAGTPTRLEQR